MVSDIVGYNKSRSRDQWPLPHLSPAAVHGSQYQATASWATMDYSDYRPHSRAWPIKWPVRQTDTRAPPRVSLDLHGTRGQTKPLSHNLNLISFRSLRQNIAYSCRTCVESRWGWEAGLWKGRKHRQGGPCRVSLCWQSVLDQEQQMPAAEAMSKRTGARGPERHSHRPGPARQLLRLLPAPPAFSCGLTMSHIDPSHQSVSLFILTRKSLSGTM